MAARGAVTPVQLAADTGTAEGAGQTIGATQVTNGLTIAAPGGYKLLLLVLNSDTNPHNVIVRASRSGVNAAGAAQTNSPSNVVFTQATVGDLTQAVAASATQVIPVVTTDRFTQDDGSISVDFSTGFTGTLWALRLPYVAS